MRLVSIVTGTNVGGAETMLEVGAGAEILELCLHHRAEVSWRMVPELDYAARIALENEDHSTPDLGCWKCHDCVQ